MFVDILIGLTNTASVSEGRIQITLLIVRRLVSPRLRRGALSLEAHITETWLILADDNWAVTFCKIFEPKHCNWRLWFHKITKLFKCHAWVPCAFIKNYLIFQYICNTSIMHQNWQWYIIWRFGVQKKDNVRMNNSTGSNNHLRSIRFF